jgi:Toprim domain-containing protein
VAAVHPDEVKRHLAVRIQALAKALFPDGKIQGAEWRGHGPDGATWGVVVRGGKTGFFQNFGSGNGGTSALALIRDAACGGDPQAAYAWALDFLGGEVLATSSPITAPASAPKPPKPAATGLAKFLGAAKFDWHNPAGLYLQARGIDPNKIAHRPGALRFDPRCWHADHTVNLPAMLAAVIDPTSRQHIALHRTYLGRNADGTWRKSEAMPAKKVMGSFAGGVIPLTRGASKKRFSDAVDGESILIGEGIENTLTVAQFFPELRALSCVAVANLPAVALPPVFRAVMLIRDRDGENRAVQTARERALVRWDSEGREVSVWEPPEGQKDANDFWRAVLGGRCEA